MRLFSNLKNYLEQSLDRQADIASLHEKFNEVSAKTDAGEKLLLLGSLKRDAARINKEANDKAIILLVPAMAVGMFGSLALAAVLANPFMGIPALVVAASGMWVRDHLGMKTMYASRNLEVKYQQAENCFANTVAPEDLARSSKFQEVMAAHPQLKERFLLESTRSIVLEKFQPEALTVQKPPTI